MRSFFSVSSSFSVSSVLKICGRKTKVEGSNREDTERGEDAEESWPHCPAGADSCLGVVKGKIEARRTPWPC
jgi:hypothetical protein